MLRLGERHLSTKACLVAAPAAAGTAAAAAGTAAAGTAAAGTAAAGTAAAAADQVVLVVELRVTSVM